MIRRKLLGISCGVALLVASSAAAQPNATVVLTSGERVSGTARRVGSLSPTRSPVQFVVSTNQCRRQEGSHQRTFRAPVRHPNGT